MNKNRPKHLTLYQIRLPLPGLISILHRLSGLLLFIALPLLLWALQYSLRSIETFTLLSRMFQHPLSKLFLLVMAWAFLHHLCAGVRYLALDFHIGSSLASARTSSKWVLVVSLALTALVGVRIW
jgi:succinate dehydrogenase / fumarate reductase, cytochrome b subunit